MIETRRIKVKHNNDLQRTRGTDRAASVNVVALASEAERYVN